MLWGSREFLANWKQNSCDFAKKLDSGVWIYLIWSSIACIFPNYRSDLALCWINRDQKTFRWGIDSTAYRIDYWRGHSLSTSDTSSELVTNQLSNFWHLWGQVSANHIFLSVLSSGILTYFERDIPCLSYCVSTTSINNWVLVPKRNWIMLPSCPTNGNSGDFILVLRRDRTLLSNCLPNATSNHSSILLSGNWALLPSCLTSWSFNNLNVV